MNVMKLEGIECGSRLVEGGYNFKLGGQKEVDLEYVELKGVREEWCIFEVFLVQIKAVVNVLRWECVLYFLEMVRRLMGWSKESEGESKGKDVSGQKESKWCWDLQVEICRRVIAECFQGRICKEVMEFRFSKGRS